MVSSSQLTVKYWGTRGSHPRVTTHDSLRDQLRDLMVSVVGAASDARDLSDQTVLNELIESQLARPYGNHSTCIEIQCDDITVIIDAGSGIRSWAANRPDRPLDNTYLLFTHNHMDHICGLPFVDQIYNARNRIKVLAPEPTINNLRQILNSDADSGNALFPVGVSQMQGLLGFESLEVSESNGVKDLGGIQLRWFRLNHPGGAVAYRLETTSSSVVIATDHEHTSVPDLDLAEFARDADLLYLDGQYTEQEYLGEAEVDGAPAQPRTGWGHSTIQACLRTGITANVKRLHIGHHEPSRSDSQLEQLEAKAKAEITKLASGGEQPPELAFAREGDVIELS